jgi:hypothetical protein
MDAKPLEHGFAIAALAILGTLLSGTASAADPAPAWSPPEPEMQVLEPGNYDWHPEYAPSGEMLIVVSLPQQQLHVYRNGIRIGRSTISSGRSGHETPTGVFPILQKQVRHRSTLYNDAPMPYMQRLTWDGIAMHAGRLPGYAASHGCIRLPLEFAKLLYDATDHDTVVIVADYDGFAPDVVSPGPTVSADMLAAVATERDQEHERELATELPVARESENAVAGIGGTP